jgi:regulator of sigma E protease
MYHFFLSAIAFLITISVVIGIHEFGHFWAARIFKIKVLRFSVGFGKKLFGFVDKKGTEYWISAIPFGGYVSLLDENEGKVAKEELHLAFNRQSVYKRLVVILAGPLLNLIFAVMLFWLMFVIGFTTVKPIIGSVTANSIANLGGLKPRQEILAIDGHKTTDWTTVAIRIFFRMGAEGILNVQAKTPTEKIAKNYQLDLLNWQIDKLQPNPIKSLGIIPYLPHIPAVIGKLPRKLRLSGKLQLHDEVLVVGKQPVKNWPELVKQIQLHPDQVVQFKIRRNQKIIYTKIKIGHRWTSLTRKKGFLGIAAQFEWPKKFTNQNKYALWSSLQNAFLHTFTFISLNLVLVGKMIVGNFSIRGLAGPLTIFTTAGHAFRLGLASFLAFLGFINVTIGVFNLLPIPGLDGAHICYFLIEAVIGRPVSMKIQMLAFRLGLLVILLIVLQAIINDVLRLVG